MKKNKLGKVIRDARIRKNLSMSMSGLAKMTYDLQKKTKGDERMVITQGYLSSLENGGETNPSQRWLNAKRNQSLEGSDIVRYVKVDDPHEVTIGQVPPAVEPNQIIPPPPIEKTSESAGNSSKKNDKGENMLHGYKIERFFAPSTTKEKWLEIFAALTEPGMGIVVKKEDFYRVIKYITFHHKKSKEFWKEQRRYRFDQNMNSMGQKQAGVGRLMRVE